MFGRLHNMALLLALAVLPGCVAYQPVTLRDGTFPLGAVRAGDDVRADARSGETLAFEVASVEGGSAMTTDEGQRVEVGDLTSLRIVRRDKHKTQVALGVLGGVAVAAFLISTAEATVVCVQYDTDVCGDGLRP
jgi:hypothetical protein